MLQLSALYHRFLSKEDWNLKNNWRETRGVIEMENARKWISVQPTTNVIALHACLKLKPFKFYQKRDLTNQIKQAHETLWEKRRKIDTSLNREWMRATQKTVQHAQSYQFIWTRRFISSVGAFAPTKKQIGETKRMKARGGAKTRCNVEYRRHEKHRRGRVKVVGALILLGLNINQN